MRGGSVSRKGVCPRCGCQEVSVQESRHVEQGVERRKECRTCKTRWITRESFVRIVTPRRRLQK